MPAAAFVRKIAIIGVGARGTTFGYLALALFTLAPIGLFKRRRPA